MIRPTWHIAVDLGAESGRVMLGEIDVAAGKIELREIHRFATARLQIGSGLHWDVESIEREILTGLAKAAKNRGTVASVSVDSWGVDYVLLGESGAPLAPPFMYRDPRTDAIFARVQADEAARRMVFEETGLQFLHFNTLYQLLADLEEPGGRELHERTSELLMTGDYFNWRLCGVARAERSLASTSQLYNPRLRGWSRRLIEHFGIRPGLLPELVDSGTILGPLRPEVSLQTGLPGSVKVIATCSHDTAAAVAATPLAGASSAYLSSGTWSLLGVELAEPIVTDECHELGFTNEVGFGHTIRLLKNISGLFILQECRGEWQRHEGTKARRHEGPDAEGAFSYARLAEMAKRVEPLRSLIRPDAPQFARVGGMTAKIAQYCGRTGQPAPESPGEFVRCIYESLALLYAETLGDIERLSGREIDTLNVVGGGSQADLLNQMTADACGVLVEAGPAEATAIGNVGIQVIAMGSLGGIDALRELVRRSFLLRRYEPRTDRLSAAVARFVALPRE